MDAPKLANIFETNVNKDFLRKTYDSALIASWRADRGKLLKYFGLPAWKMLDIIEWQEHLDRFTTVEREENQQHLLFLKANVANVEHRLCALYGEFDEILLSGRDRYQKTPEWPFGIVNLDYFGGFIYPNMSRPKAIRKLIQNQAVYEESFMLIITQQLRDRDVANEKLGFLKDLRKCLHNAVVDGSLHPSIDKVVDWYESGEIPDAARQALYMNYFLRDCGEAEHFDVCCRPAVIYSGSGGAWMIHFVTDFRYQAGSGHRTASDQSLIEVINLGLLEAREGGFADCRFVQPKLPCAGENHGMPARGHLSGQTHAGQVQPNRNRGKYEILLKK